MVTTKKLSKTSRNAFLSIINYCFEIWRVDLDELKGNGEPYNDYRKLRPYGSCNCWGGTPEEEERYHEVHIKRCLTYVDEMQSFVRQITDLIKDKGKQLNQRKKQAIKRIKEKDITRVCFDYSKHEAPINNCTNSKQLSQKEQEITQEVEQISSQAQANEKQRRQKEEENEKLRKEEETKQLKNQEEWEEKEKKSQEEWDKINQEEKEFNRLSFLILDSKDLTTLEKNWQIVKNSPLYTNSKITFGTLLNNKEAFDLYFKSQENVLKSLNSPPDNHGNEDKEPKDLKNKFHEIYQKGKKYTWIELMKLQNIISIIEKKIGLDGDLQEAKKELQIISDKVAPYQHETFFIMARGEKVEEILKGMGKQELESCKKALEETEKIIYLSEKEKFLLSKITEKLKINNLESEIKDLKSQNSGTQTPPEQKAENQKKIAEKEQELEELKQETAKNQKPTSQEIATIKTQITQTLKKHNLKTTDLPKKYHNWEEQLSKLTTQEQINSFVAELNQQIENKSKGKQNHKENNNNQQSLSFSLTTKLVIGGVIIMLIVMVLGVKIIIKKRASKIRTKPNHK